ncbi:hypothetical protein D3C72_1319390 [compost metagenome]
MRQGRGLRLGQQLFHLVFVERFQHIHLRARQQRRVHFKAGVFSGGANKRHQARFDEGQQGILLRLVEPVDLVNEQ